MLSGPGQPFPSQLSSERFDLKLFLSLDLIRELVALQHRQTTGEVERMGDFAPDYRELLKADSMDGVLPSGLEYTLRSCDAKGKKGIRPGPTLARQRCQRPAVSAGRRAERGSLSSAGSGFPGELLARTPSRRRASRARPW